MLIAHIVYYVNNILLQGHTQPYTQALSCGGKSLVTLGGLSRLLCYVIIRVISVGNAPFWGNYYAIPRSLTSSCRYYQCLLRCLVTNYSKLFVLVMTNKRAGHSLYTRLRNLLSIKSVERSEQQVQPSLNKLAIPSAVLAICPNLSAVLTVQGSSCCLLSTPLDGHASA